MVSERKKKYMKQYNQKSAVKEKKSAYMRRVRAEEDRRAARKIVETFLDFGFEDLAEDFAKERAPEMLLTLKAKRRY